MTQFNPLIDAKVSVVSGIGPLIKAWEAGHSTGNVANPLRLMLRKWSARYLGFVRRRFDRASKGDGTWKPLAKSTLLARRHGGAGGVTRRKASTKRQALAVLRSKGKGASSPEAAAILGSASILRDTGVLFAALNPGAPGALEQPIPGGIRVGFAAASHGTSPITIQRLAAIHNSGGSNGRPPARPILVAPDGPTVAGMRADAKVAVAALLKAAAAKATEVVR